MKEKFKLYFTLWWIPIVSYFFIIGVFFLGCVFKRDWIINLFLLMFFINIIGTLISSIIQITRKKWLFIIPQIGIIFILFCFFSTIFLFSPPDYYGTHKKIPIGIEIDNPLEKEPREERRDTA